MVFVPCMASLSLYMKVDQFSLAGGRIVYAQQQITEPQQAHFVLLFTSRARMEEPDWLQVVQQQYKGVPVVSCSTSGEIYELELQEDSISAVAVMFENTAVEIASTHIDVAAESFQAGQQLAQKLNNPSIKHLLVFSDGWIANGTQLIQGLYSELGKGVTISGGLAGDGANFSKTMVGLNNDINAGNAVAIGLYGDALQVGYGTHGGWNEYGPCMQITRYDGRTVYELDGKPALDLYKEHLAQDADGLPGTALLYPVAISAEGSAEELVRTVFGIDEINKALVLGEPVTGNCSLRFMKAHFDNLLQGVDDAAQQALDNLQKAPQLALVVSCIGRKLLFGQDIDQELTITRQKLGQQTVALGFYSYGEICPVNKEFAKLHHQMLTVTTLAE